MSDRKHDEQPTEPKTPIPGSSGGPADEEWVGGGELGDAEDDRDD